MEGSGGMSPRKKMGGGAPGWLSVTLDPGILSLSPMCAWSLLKTKQKRPKELFWGLFLFLPHGNVIYLCCNSVHLRAGKIRQYSLRTIHSVSKARKHLGMTFYSSFSSPL